jgi:hypothetical protein
MGVGVGGWGEVWSGKRYELSTGILLFFFSHLLL